MKIGLSAFLIFFFLSFILSTVAGKRDSDARLLASGEAPANSIAAQPERDQKLRRGGPSEKENEELLEKLMRNNLVLLTRVVSGIILENEKSVLSGAEDLMNNSREILRVSPPKNRQRIDEFRAFVQEIFLKIDDRLGHEGKG